MEQSRRRWWMIIDNLPDEVLQEILIRIPAKCIPTCRLVCRRWKALISTHHFCESHHLRRGNSRRNSYNDDDLTLLVEEFVRPLDAERVLDRDYFKVGKKLYMFEDAWRGQGRGSETEEAAKNDDDQTSRRLRPVIMSPPWNNNNNNLGWVAAAYDDRDENDESLMHVSFPSCGLVILSYRKQLDGCFSIAFYHRFTIVNPITGQKVKLRIANKDAIRARIFGAFFHPFQKHMCILFGLVAAEPLWPYPLGTDSDFFVEEFKLLNLEPNAPKSTLESPHSRSWKSINNESARRILTRHLQPRSYRTEEGPVISEGYMYWMVEDATLDVCPQPNPCQEAIIAFHTTSHEFRLLPHPASLPCCGFSQGIDVDDPFTLIPAQKAHELMHLFEYKDHRGQVHLSFFHFSDISPESISFNIWIKEKQQQGEEDCLWTKIHTVKHSHHLYDIQIPSYMAEYPDRIFSDFYRPIGVIDGQTLLVHSHRGEALVAFNLERGTLAGVFETRIGAAGNRNGRIFSLDYASKMFLHTHTLIPITNDNLEILLL